MPEKIKAGFQINKPANVDGCMIAGKRPNFTRRTIPKFVNNLIAGIIVVCSFIICDNIFAQQLIHVNEQQYQTNRYTPNYSGTGGTWSGWSGWSNGGNGGNYFGNIATLVSSIGNAGGTVELCNDVASNYTHIPGTYNSAGTSYNYRSGWNNGASASSAGGSMNINTGYTVTLLNRLSNYGTTGNRLTINNISKDGGGTLILNYAGPASQFYLNSTTLNGNAGTLQIGSGTNSVNYNSTNAAVGAPTGFNANVNTGSTWNNTNLTARQVFNLVGAGTATATNTTVSGTTTSTIANFNTGALSVGVPAGDGNLFINAGNVTTTTANIANGGLNGNVRLNGNNVLWTTSGLTNVGNSGANSTGTVDIWNGRWQANNQVNIANVAGGNGGVNLAGANSIWNAAGQTINVGLNGNGSVHQSNGTWTNRNTNVGVNTGSVGTIEQSGGSHEDVNVIVGVNGTGIASVHGSGTTWKTEVQYYRDETIIGQNAGSYGSVSIYDNAKWNIGGSIVNDLITAYYGKGELNIYSNAEVTLTGDNYIARETDSYGIDRIYSGGKFNITGGVLTGYVGRGQMKIYSTGVVNMTGGNNIAGVENSYGSVQIDGIGSEMNMQNLGMTIGDYGYAGGRYVYYPEGSIDSAYGAYFNNAGRTNLGEVSIGGGNYKDPDVWLGSKNLDLLENDVDWAIYQENAPGLAITSGGKVYSKGAVSVATASASYAYILLDSKDTTGRSTLTIDDHFVIGVMSRQNDNRDDAYMRIINGSLVSIFGALYMSEGEGSSSTIRVNGSQGSNNSTLDIGLILKVADGYSNPSPAEGNLYVYDKGQVNVGTVTQGGGAAIAYGNNSYGRVHVDGIGSKMNIEGTIFNVGTSGQAGGRYKYIADNNPSNDNADDPSYNGKWFDSPNTLSDLKIQGGINDNAPGFLISRGGVVESSLGDVAVNTNSYAYVVVDGKDAAAHATRLTISDSYLTIAKEGEAYVRIMNGGLIETKNSLNGDIIIADMYNSIGTVRVFNKGSKIDAVHDLTVAHETSSNGQLYIYDGASGHVGNDMIIADEREARAQVQVDGEGSTLEVEHRLTVAYSGNADMRYNENRYEPPITTDPTIADNGYRLDPSDLNSPTDKWWFDSPNMDWLNNRNYGGNAPGLAITDGGFVVSGGGVVGVRSIDGDDLDSVGYIVIDNHYGFNGASGRQGSRSTWHVKETVGGAADQNGDLIIGREGKGFIRVLNGGLLEVDGHTKLNSRIDNNDNTNYYYAGKGNLYVVGNGGHIRAIPHWATATRIPSYVTPYEDGTRSTWISKKSTVLGDTGGNVRGGEATIRINNGAYGETHGIYAGYSEDARGDVSVMGKASELHIYKDEQLGTPGYAYTINDIKGSGGLSVSNHALLQLHNESNITLNGMSTISHNSLLHLDRDSILDSRSYSSKIVNARVEGIGTITAENGVMFLYDSNYAESLRDPVYDIIDGKFAETVSHPTSAQIDPGLYFGWHAKDEYYDRYGKLTFGDRLTLVGNVNTFFDVNSGWPIPGDLSAPGAPVEQLNDTVVVKRGDSSTSTADILATLSGTLKIHARLTGYFVDEPSFQVVQTIGDNKSGQFVPGRITDMFDRLEIVPWRFFESPHQEIRQDTNKNDSLWISMELKENPFEDAGQTYNEKSTGEALDDIYHNRDERWLPLLRFFWYLDDPEFLEAYRTLSGEIRAHSLLLPLQNPWLYNQNRSGFRRCWNKSHNHGYDKPERFDPCQMAKMAENVKCDTYCSLLVKCWDKCKKDMRFWGDYIYDRSEYDSDGNAGAFKLHRNGVVFGFDKPTSDNKQYFGFQFAFARGELDARLSEACVDDFNFGLYHGKKIRNVFEWRNFLGMGVEGYKVSRELDSGLAYYDWVWDTPDGLPSSNPSDGHYKYSDEIFNGKLRSSFNGYSFYANTEIARPFILGSCNQYTIRPYAAIDIVSSWQDEASESGDFRGAEFVKLDFMSASHLRVFGRPGILFERNGDHLTFHAGLSYSFQMGGRHYAHVNNKFQFGGRTFNIRSVDTGNDFLNLNCGTEWYIGKKRNQFVMLNYQALFGKNVVTQAAQIGYQYKF
ncbi:MAG: hypothetical protein LBL39_07050 [Planctomycetaceae bacterium]|nr:hypothetical protein [Planctomycetaceae bacterium]